ncbi:hypothetical protein [Vibrio owensii]|uniref:hypothetical protein n=1 Tax=Vibrio harveyi group TaxID=717610 RepID=UPI003CC6B3B5
MESSKNYIMDLYPNNHELVMLDKLSHEFNNFKKTFKGKLNHTYVLSPAASDMFGLDIIDGKPMIGIPHDLFQDFFRVRWYILNIIENAAGLYLVFDMGTKPDNHPVALRIYKRKKQVASLSKHKRVGVVQMDLDGKIPKLSKDNYFELPIKTINEMKWEKL